MGFLNGGNSKFNTIRGPEYYKDVMKADLEEKYKSGARNVAWRHVFILLGLVALFIFGIILLSSIT